MAAKILMVEHDPNDIELIQRELSKAELDYEAKVVQTREAYENALKKFNPDLILSDYSLPTFDGPTAFKMKEKMSPHTPFIFVSGTIGEENSIELLKNGVTDYALKDKLFTLNPKIKRALRESKAAQERLIAETELKKNEMRLARAQQVAHIGSWQTNLHNFQVIWSDEVYRIFEIDIKTSQASHTDFLNFVHPEDLDKVNNAFFHSIENKTTNNIIDHRIITAKGQIKYLEERWEILYDEMGNALLAEGTCQDITEKKEAEIRLAQSEKHFRALIHNIVDGIILINGNNELVYQSPSAERINGFSLEELKGKTVFEQIHPDEIEDCMALFQKAIANPGVPLSNSYRALHKQGHYIWIEGTITNLLHDESVKAFIVNYRDISEKKRAEQSLKESEAFNKGVLASLSSHIAVIDTKGNVISVNKAWENFAKENGVTVLERAGTGTNYFDVCQIAVLKGDGIAQDALRGIESVINGENSFFEMRYPCHSPTEERWFMMRVVKFKNVRDQFVVAHEDITKIVKAEQAIIALNESLEQKVIERTAQLTEANKALEAFSYSVSHDLKSPVRSIVGFARIIQKDYGASFSDDLKELFTHVESSAKRMQAIIDDLLTLAKFGKEKLKPATVNMNQLIEKVWDEICFSLPNRATLKVEALPDVQGDVSMLQQVIVNLLSNAVKYSSKKETPLIHIGFENHDVTTTYFVKDNGAGFDMRHYNRMFGAFQRLHGMSDFEGTGIGLLLVKQIIERHAGTVWAEGKTGEGATFYFSLPSKF